MGKHKKRKKEKKSKRHSSSSDEDSSETEWVEKEYPDNQKSSTPPPRFSKPQLHREDWLDIGSVFSSNSSTDRKISRELEKLEKKQEDQYNPGQSVRELNPYWKNGGSGLPTFKKPTSSDDETQNDKRDEYLDNTDRKRYNWKVPKSLRSDDIQDNENETKTHKDISTVNKNSSQNTIPTSLDPNIIAAKLVKAEIMGNTKLVEELKIKLEQAKQNKIEEKEATREILLTQTDSKGYSRPLKINDDSKGRSKKRRVETYTGRERTKYYADDDKYSLKQMFEAEKYNSIDSANKEFAKIASKVGKNDSLEDIFVDNIRHQGTSKDFDQAIHEQRKMVKYVDNCTRCLQSDNMIQHLIINYDETTYLTLPHHEPLTEGHCLISPIKHVSCSVQLDENEWNEVNKFRSKLVNLFEKQGKSVVFFEIAKSLHKFPHMVIECVPIPIEKSEIAPVYFKKAIEESETEWSHNKKLISLKNRDIIRAVPKGLPYFFVSFGMSEGFAHVIEDQSMFPSNFAQEVIGGMLDIHHSKWKKPRRESYDSQKLRVTEFKNWWKSI